MWLLLSLVATRCVQGLLPPISGRKHAYALKKVKMSASIDVDIAVIGSGIAGKYGFSRLAHFQLVIIYIRILTIH
jgi:hypothetical protein